MFWVPKVLAVHLLVKESALRKMHWDSTRRPKPYAHLGVSDTLLTQYNPTACYGFFQRAELDPLLLSNSHNSSTSVQGLESKALLHTLLETVLLRRTKEVKLKGSLPKKSDFVCICDLSDLQLRAYQCASPLHRARAGYTHSLSLQHATLLQWRRLLSSNTARVGML